MNGGRHAAGDGSFARSAGGAMTRGIVLIVVAVLIGIILVRTGTDDTGSAAPAASVDTTAPTTTAAASVTETTAATDDTTETTAGDADTTETTVTETTVASSDDTTPTTNIVFEARPNSEVRVQVANTTSVGGAAGRQTDVLKEQAYISLNATNYTAGVLATTKVHHKDGYLLEAQAIARLLNLDPDADVFSMPPNVDASIGDFLDPDVLVLLGSDLAS